MRTVRRLLSWLLYGGTTTLRDYETRILDHVSASLSTDNDRAALASQLRNLNHLKRLHQDRMVTFYFDDSESLRRLSNMSPAHQIGVAVLEKDRESTTAKVVSHRGLLSSMEFTRSPTQFQHASFQLADSRRPGKAIDLPSQIDAEEHGDGAPPRN